MEKLKVEGVERNDIVRKINELVEKTNNAVQPPLDCEENKIEESLKCIEEKTIKLGETLDTRLTLLEHEVAKNLLTFHLSAPNINKEAILKSFKELSSVEFIKQHGIKVK